MQIAVFTGDKRQWYLAEALKENHRIVYIGKGDSGTECICDCDSIILPTPSFTEEARRILEKIDGLGRHVRVVFGCKIPKDFGEWLKEQGIRVVDLMESEEVTLLNAIATAEGAVAEAIMLSPTNLHGSRALVLGFGRCGKVLAEKLKGLCREVCVAVRRSSAEAEANALGFETVSFSVLKKEAENFDYLFNTVPAPVLTKDVLEKINRDAVIIDIASSPGGTDFDYCLAHEIRAKLCGGLPGIYSPRTSGEILAEAVERRLK